MANQQIQGNNQNSNPIHGAGSNPIAEAVTALRGVVNRFKGEDKEFETLFTVCVDSVEKEPPSYERSLIWHDALLYLADNDPDLRRGSIVESIARRMVSAYEDDYLPAPPQYTPPTVSTEPAQQPTLKQPKEAHTTSGSLNSDSKQGAADNHSYKRELAPSAIDRETIYWQLCLVASVIGSGYTLELTENAYSGLTTLVYGIAEQVFPEGKKE